MHNIRSIKQVKFVLAVVAATALAGCSTFNRPYPQKELFGIDPGQPAATRAVDGETRTGVLRVRRLVVSSPYGERSFLYKVGEGRYETDYYHGFITTPALMLTGSLVGWLGQTGPYASVVEPRSGANAEAVLEGNVTALYGDYTGGKTAAVVETKFILLDERDAAGRVLMEKTYRARVPVAGMGPEQMAVGMGKAWRQVLEQLTEDLRGRR